VASTWGGKSLGQLRTEEINLILKPLDKGTFQIKPRILYLDEAGKYKSHEPEPATVVVKELGISGWLKGLARDKQSRTRSSFSSAFQQLKPVHSHQEPIPVSAMTLIGSIEKLGGRLSRVTQ